MSEPWEVHESDNETAVPIVWVGPPDARSGTDVLSSQLLGGGERLDQTGVDVIGPDAHEVARRIVACVNACEGIPTETLEKVAETLGTPIIVRLPGERKEDVD